MGIEKFKKLLKQTKSSLPLLLFFLLLIAFSCSKKTGEMVVEVSAKNQLDEEELRKRVNQHKRLLSECFRDYMEFSTMIDSSGKVTMDALDNFKSLFIANARVWNDVSVEPKMVDAGFYADNIFDYMSNQGVNVEYEENILNKFYTVYTEIFEPEVVTSDLENETMKYKFQAKKKVYNQLDKENQLLNYEEPVVHELEFIFYVSSIGQWAKIMDIKPLNY